MSSYLKFLRAFGILLVFFAVLLFVFGIKSQNNGYIVQALLFLFIGISSIKAKQRAKESVVTVPTPVGQTPQTYNVSPEVAQNVQVRAYLLKNMLSIGSKAGTLSLSHDKLNFVSEQNESLMEGDLTQLVVDNKTFPAAYFQVDVNNNTYKFTFTGIGVDAVQSAFIGEEFAKNVLAYQQAARIPASNVGVQNRAV